MKRLSWIVLVVLMASLTHADLLLHYSFDGDLTDATGVYDGEDRKSVV